MALALAFGGVVGLTSFAAVQTGWARQDHVEVISGPARVIDGDTIDIRGRRIRLEGIDAPESAQTCPGRYAGGILGNWSCGKAATAALIKLIGNRSVTCQSQETDKYDRLIATCFAGGRDVNAEMVRCGHAWAFVKYSRTYVALEAQAKAQKLGVWASLRTAEPAWNYRKHRWAKAKQVAPTGCAIKGNISRGGERIYHAPWSPWYDKVRISTAKGERWFCDEQEAIAAGWRSAVGQ